MNNRIKVRMVIILLLSLFLVLPVVAEDKWTIVDINIGDMIIIDSGATIKIDQSATGNKFVEGEYLLIDQYLISSTKNYILYMQSDGNLVFFKTNGYASIGSDWNPSKWTKIWATDTAGTPGAYAKMSYGDLRLCNTQGGMTLCVAPIPVQTQAGSYLQVQDDGNLVLYSPSKSPLWAIK